MDSYPDQPEEDFIATLLKQSSSSSHDNKAYSTTPSRTSSPRDSRTSQPLVRHNGHQQYGNQATTLQHKDKTASPHASHLSLTDPLLDDKVYSALAYGIYGLLLFFLTTVTTICLIVLT